MHKCAATYRCFPSINLATAAASDMDTNNNQHAFPGMMGKGKKRKLHYQLKLLSWQRKYQTFNIPSVNLIHNTYCSLCVRKYPKIASVTCNLQHQLECAAKTPPNGQQFERNICLWWNTKKVLLFWDIYNGYTGPLSLWVEPRNILSALLFTFCSPLLILQRVMIIKVGLVALQSCKKVYIDFCSLAAVSEIALCF